MIVNQVFGLVIPKKGVRWLKKVNAEKKFGVAVLFYGVLKITREVAKNEQKTCTEAWDVCKNLAFPRHFFIWRG